MRRQSLRPSQIITTFGPGSIVDLPEDSAMIEGTNFWAAEARPMKPVPEPRLQAILEVSEFRAPPTGSPWGRDVPHVYFPAWRVCPKCHSLSEYPARRGGAGPVGSAPICSSCHSGRTYPARIVVACPKGHIADFPWYQWVHPDRPCRSGRLNLRGAGKSAGLRDLTVACSCDRRRTLAGALRAEAMERLGYRCPGKRPWLGDTEEDCDEKLFALQRGASNLYFAVTRSALSIPPWTDELQERVTSKWAVFPVKPPRQNWPEVIPYLFPGDPIPEVIRCLERLEKLKEKPPAIREEEHELLASGRDSATSDFKCVNRTVEAWSSRYLSRLVSVPRLREVRVLRGFTRISPPENDPTTDDIQELPVKMASLSTALLDWLPAVENRGEGVYLELSPDTVQLWESGRAVSARAKLVFDAYDQYRSRRGLRPLARRHPRLILLHTLAHALIRQMSLDCGYSSSSLRERLYCADAAAGVLISTSGPDSDGSLGGLVRLSEPARFDEILQDALENLAACSSDPLCAELDPASTGRPIGAACHACVMASETSCELGNRLLDRKFLLDLQLGGNTGYFARPS